MQEITENIRRFFSNKLRKVRHQRHNGLVVAGLFACALLHMGCQEELPRTRIPVPHSPQELQTGARMPIRSNRSNRPSSGTQRGGVGLTWKRPSQWQEGGRRPMRMATYWIPGATSASKGECSIFYFGPNAGGIQANIDRWRKQFQFPSQQSAAQQVQRENINIGAIRVALVTIHGTYMDSVRPMSPQKIARPSYSMLGAIARGPRGPIFFKCVGPQSTMQTARADFRKMIFSLKTR